MENKKQAGPNSLARDMAARRLFKFELGWKNSIRNLKTRESFTEDLNCFIQFLHERNITHQKEITRGLFIDYKSELDSKYSTATVKRRIMGLKSYYKYVKNVTGEVVVIDEANLSVKVESQLTPGISNVETIKILDDCLENEHIAYAAAIHCLFLLGLRRSELSSLLISDYDVANKSLSIMGKGGKQRVLPVPDALTDLIARAIELRTEGPLFSVDGVSPFYENALANLLKRSCKRCGVRRISPHSARVTAVSNALENGANPVYVQAMGGWSSMEMVTRYDRRRNDLKNSAVYKIRYK